MGPDGDQALSRSGRSTEDHVGAGHDLDERLLLGRVQAQPSILGPGAEEIEDGIRIGRGSGPGGEQLGQVQLTDPDGEPTSRAYGRRLATFDVRRPTFGMIATLSG